MSKKTIAAVIVLGVFFWVILVVVGTIAVVLGWAVPQFSGTPVNPAVTAIGAAGVIGSLIAAYIFFAFVVGILGFIFWLWMVVDCLKKQFSNSTDKIAWVLVLIFTYILGAAIYYFLVKRAK